MTHLHICKGWREPVIATNMDEPPASDKQTNWCRGHWLEPFGSIIPQKSSVVVAKIYKNRTAGSWIADAFQEWVGFHLFFCLGSVPHPIHNFQVKLFSLEDHRSIETWLRQIWELPQILWLRWWWPRSWYMDTGHGFSSIGALGNRSCRWGLNIKCFTQVI